MKKMAGAVLLSIIVSTGSAWGDAVVSYSYPMYGDSIQLQGYYDYAYVHMYFECVQDGEYTDGTRDWWGGIWFNCSYGASGGAFVWAQVGAPGGEGEASVDSQYQSVTDLGYWPCDFGAYQDQAFAVLDGYSGGYWTC
jgi:hypothetical protein